MNSLLEMFVCIIHTKLEKCLNSIIILYIQTQCDSNGAISEDYSLNTLFMKVKIV